MNTRQALASLLHGFVLLLLSSIGFFFVCLPYLPVARLEIVEILLNRPELLTSFGLGSFAFVFMFFLGFYSVNRGRFLRLKMGAQSVEIDHKLISKSLEECFHAHFKEKISLVGVTVDSQIDIDIKLAPLDEGEREELFLRVEVALQTLLKERFGYTKPFYLTATL